MLLGVGAAVVILAWLSHGPSYHGTGLGRWLRDLRHPSPLLQHRAQEAVRHMGSSALPVLRNKLHAADSPLTTNIVNLLQRQTLVPIPFVPARERRIRAALACAILGPVAEPAIPDLLEFSQGDAFCANLAQSALGQIGERAVGALSLTLTHTNYNLREVAAGALVHVGPQASAAIPALRNCLKDDYAGVRANAARALGRIGIVSPSVVRALVEAFSDPFLDVRCCAWAAVTGFGKPAVPMLSTLLKDDDDAVRTGAEKALREINAAEHARKDPVRSRSIETPK